MKIVAPKSFAAAAVYRVEGVKVSRTARLWVSRIYIPRYMEIARTYAQTIIVRWDRFMPLTYQSKSHTALPTCMGGDVCMHQITDESPDLVGRYAAGQPNLLEASRSMSMKTLPISRVLTVRSDWQRAESSKTAGIVLWRTRGGDTEYRYRSRTTIGLCGHSLARKGRDSGFWHLPRR